MLAYRAVLQGLVGEIGMKNFFLDSACLQNLGTLGSVRLEHVQNHICVDHIDLGNDRLHIFEHT